MRKIVLTVLILVAWPALAGSRIELCSTKEECAERIYEIVRSNWYPPETASAETTSRVRVKLSDDVVGKVEDVEVLESSGSESFDGSTVDALLTIGTLATLTGLEKEVYQEHFREFIIQFEIGTPKALSNTLTDEEFIKSLPSYSGSNE